MATQPPTAADIAEADLADVRQTQIEQQQRQIEQQQQLIEQQQQLLEQYRQDSRTPLDIRLAPQLTKRGAAVGISALCAAVYHRHMLNAGTREDAYLETHYRRLTRGALIATTILSRPLLEIRLGKPIPDQLMSSMAPDMLRKASEHLAKLPQDTQSKITKTCDDNADTFDQVVTRFGDKRANEEKWLRF